MNLLIKSCLRTKIQSTESATNIESFDVFLRGFAIFT